MKKILGISIILSNLLLASPYTDAELVLKDTFKADFKCSTTGCISKDLLIDDSNSKITADNVKIDFYNKDLKFNYDKKKATDKIIKECSGDVSCEKSGIELMVSKYFSEIVSQSKNIEVININILNKETNKKTSFGKLSFSSDNQIPEFKNIETLKLSDFVFGITILAEDIETEEKNDILKYLKLVLPLSETGSYDKNTGKFTTSKNPIVENINSKIEVMYSHIVKLINSKQKGDFKLRIYTKENNKDLDIRLGLDFNSVQSGDINLALELHFKDAASNISAMSKMKDNGMFLLATASNSIILDKIVLAADQGEIFNIHTGLLSNPDYKKNYDVLSKDILDNKSKFSFIDLFKYEIIGLQHKEGTVTVTNKNALPAMQALSAIENNELIEKVVEYK